MKLPTTDTVVANLLHHVAKAAIDGDYVTLTDTQQRLAALACLLFPEGTKRTQPKRSPLNTKPTQREQIATELAALAITERAYVASIGREGQSKPEAWKRYYDVQCRLAEIALKIYRDTETIKRTDALKKGRT